MENKKWFRSKTIWFNILSGIVGTVMTLQSDKGVSPEAQKILGGIVLGGNLILRFFTDSSIKGESK